MPVHLTPAAAGDFIGRVILHEKSVAGGIHVVYSSPNRCRLSLFVRKQPPFNLWGGCFALLQG